MLSGRYRSLALAALAAGTLVTFASTADAQRRSARAFCSEGRTADGACVNPAAAQAARLTACAGTQGGLSRSGGVSCAPVGVDRNYRYPDSVYADAYRNPGPPTHFAVPSTRYTSTY